MRRLIPVVVVALLAQYAAAQDKPLPPPRDFTPETKEARDVLPALTLPEYVITGSDMISFTEDRKGNAAAPESRDFTARAGRGDREARFFDTFPTRMPQATPDLTGSSERFRMRAGIGTFTTPLIEAWYADRYPQGDAAAHMAYERSNGHVARADYSRIDLGLNGGTYLPRTLHPLLSSSRVQGDLRIESGKYGLYADKLARRDPSLDFDREVLGFDAGADLISRRNAVLEHALRFSFGHYAIDEIFGVRDTIPLDAYRQIENRLALEGKAKARFEGHPLHLALLMHVNDLSESGPGARRPFHTTASAGSAFTLGARFRLDASASAYLYRGSDHASQFRLYPSVTLRHLTSDDWTLFAGWQPEVREQTLRGYLRQNPYLMLASVVRHTDLPLRFLFGAAYDDRAESSARVFLEYLSTESWPRFSLLPDPVAQQWEMRYDGRTGIVNINAELVHSFTSHTRIQAGAVLRSSRTGEHKGRVPYLPDYEVRALLQHEFPTDLRVQTSLELIGEQEGDGSVVPAWMLLGLDIEYRLLRNVGVFLHFENLLDRSWQRWPGYRERPFFMMGGVSVHL